MYKGEQQAGGDAFSPLACAETGAAPTEASPQHQQVDPPSLISFSSPSTETNPEVEEQSNSDAIDEIFEELKDDEGKVSIKGEMTCTCWFKITCTYSVYNLKRITSFIRLDEAHGGGY